jgi:hypothetical protein
VSAEESLIAAIERNLVRMQRYSEWSIGLATDPDHRQRELEYPSFWRFWHPETVESARHVMAYFVDKGMKPDGEHGRNPTYVYLF